MTCRIRDFGSHGLMRGWLGNGGAGGIMRLFKRGLRWERVGM